MKNIAILILCFFAISLFVSCEHEEEDYNNNTSVDKYVLPENMKIVGLEFLNDDTGLLCGGEKNISGGIFKTIDGGESWTKVFNSDSLSVNNIFYLSDSVVYACGDSLLFLKSINGGNTWEIVQLGNLPYDSYYVPYNCVYANSEDNVFIVGGEHYNKGLWSETETGNYPWIHDSYDNQFNAICFLSEYVGFFGGYGILLVTEDGGNTFDNIDLYGNDFVDLDTDQYQTVYALSETGVLFSSTDIGYNWTTEIDDYTSEFTSMYFGDNLSVVCGRDGVVYMKTPDTGWTKSKNMPDVNFYCSFVKSNNEVILGSDNGEIYILNKKRTT
jgi:photosystem II stability/assembly factor-like uncharacterized protein